MPASSPGSRSRDVRWARRSHFVPEAGQVLSVPSWAGSSHLGRHLALMATSWPPPGLMGCPAGSPAMVQMGACRAQHLYKAYGAGVCQ